jgi:hypothetical protein
MRIYQPETLDEDLQQVNDKEASRSLCFCHIEAERRAGLFVSYAIGFFSRRIDFAF